MKKFVYGAALEALRFYLKNDTSKTYRRDNDIEKRVTDTIDT